MAKRFSKPELSRKINGDQIFDRDDQKHKHSYIKRNVEKDEEVELQRFDIALAESYPEYSRSSIQKFIKNGFCTLNGETETHANTIINPEEDEVELDASKIENKPQLEPEIIYEDEHVIALNKPAGMLSMAKGDFCSENTIENYGMLVHRLDRDTSGILIVAKDEDTKSFLQKQFQQRKTKKVYFAVVEGKPKLDQAIINLPLTRNLKKPTTFIVSEDGREAITEYKVVGQNDRYSLLEVKLHTGRTHQIRVHMNYLGCPILGDKVYNQNSKSKADRMYLHAASLEVTIPKHAGSDHNERVTFTADLPKEFVNIVK